MGRIPRLQAPELHYHVIVRCNNRSFLFENDNDFETYLAVLRSVIKKHKFKLFNYELMNSHVHLFLQPSSVFSLSRTMHAINRGYAQLHNKKRKRPGHFWVDRYKNIPVQEDEHALALMRYINRNAIRAGMVKKPGDWKFSGYRFYATLEPNDLLEPHPSFLGLGNDDSSRSRQYQELVCQAWPGDEKKQPEFNNARYIGPIHFGKKLGFEEEE